MRITPKDLRRVDAYDAVMKFQEDFPSGIDREWDIVCQYLMLANHYWRPWWGWFVYAGLIPAWSMHGADMRDTDLRNADLRGADLQCADLSHADLRGANLTNADLRGANLTDTNLRYADLRGAIMSHADLSNATMPDGSTHN